jgi:hypothetical protein
LVVAAAVGVIVAVVVAVLFVFFFVVVVVVVVAAVCAINEPLPSTRTGWGAAVFVQNRSAENFWAFEGCFFGCIAHSLFNLTNPEASPGKIYFGRSNVTATITLGPGLVITTMAKYRGPRFGCQADNGAVRAPLLADHLVAAS